MTYLRCFMESVDKGELWKMINLALSVPGNFYREAITKALERTGDFRVRALEEFVGQSLNRDAKGNLQEEVKGNLQEEEIEKLLEEEKPEVALLGVSVHQGFTLKERRNVIRDIRERAPNCKIVLFLDELVSPEQTEGVKNLKQARLIDGFLYASGTMEYLIATLESI